MNGFRGPCGFYDPPKVVPVFNIYRPWHRIVPRPDVTAHDRLGPPGYQTGKNVRSVVEKNIAVDLPLVFGYVDFAGGQSLFCYPRQSVIDREVGLGCDDHYLVVDSQPIESLHSTRESVEMTKEAGSVQGRCPTPELPHVPEVRQVRYVVPALDGAGCERCSVLLVVKAGPSAVEVSHHSVEVDS